MCAGIDDVVDVRVHLDCHSLSDTEIGPNGTTALSTLLWTLTGLQRLEYVLIELWNITGTNST